MYEMTDADYQKLEGVMRDLYDDGQAELGDIIFAVLQRCRRA